MNIWEKQKGEGAKAFQAFTLFRDDTEGRSYPAVARALSKSLTIIKRWGARWNWVSRAEAFDAHNDRARLEGETEARRKKAEEWESARLDMAYRQAENATMIQAKGFKRLSDLNDQQLTPREALACVIEGAKLERLARGEVTERTVTETASDEQARKVTLAKEGNEKLKRDYPDLPAERRLAMVKATFGVDLSGEKGA